MTDISFYLLDDGLRVECRIHPQGETSLDAKIIREAWKKSEFSAGHLIEEAIENTVSHFAQDVQTTQQNPDDDNTPNFSFIIGEKRTAVARTEIAENKMTATLFITAAAGGKHLGTAQITELLARGHVVFDVNEAEIERLLDRAGTCRGGSELSAVVARGGTAAGEGTPSRFKVTAVPFQDRVLVPQMRDDGTLDMRDLGDIETVRRGQVLIERIPASAEHDGHDVTGNSVPSQPPPDTPFEIGEGTEVSAQNPHHLVASRAGIAHRRGRGMIVDDVLLVQDVDLKVGNLRYEGSVYVLGDIRNNMSLECAGDIVVNGFVEAARIHCEGDLIVRHGIIGRPVNPDLVGSSDFRHDCDIKARDITARYAQYARLDARGNISMSSQLTHCTSYCQQLSVGGEVQRRAKLIGGEVHAVDKISVGIVGSEAGAVTRIFFHDGLQTLVNELKELDGKLSRARKRLQENAAAVKKFELVPEARRDRAALVLAVKNFQAGQQECETLQSERSTKQAELDKQQLAVRFTVFNVAYPGTEVHCLNKKFKVRNEMKAGILGMTTDGWKYFE